ncbi:MAG: zinc-ribbon domain-containing protein [Thermodesulfobacteriota bacterium]
MKVACSRCKTEYNIADEKIADKKINARCNKCGETFAVNPGGKNREQIIVTMDSSTAASPPLQEEEISPRAAAIPPDHPLFTAYPELLGLSGEQFDFMEIFNPDKKGNYKNDRNKFKVKILTAVSEKVTELLNGDEKVMRVAKGAAYYPSELLFGNGYLTMLYNQYAIVCTEKRLVFINVNPKVTSYTHYLFQLPYNQIKNVKKGMVFGRLIFNKKQGKRRLFNGVKRYLMKEIAEFVAGKVAAAPAGQSGELLEDLCPACYTPLKKGLANCSACSAAFKSPRKAALRSLLLPGLGDIYLGHKLLGALELIGSLVVWFIIVTILASGEEGGWLIALILLLFVNGFDGIMTYFMATKGYLLEKS